MENLSQRVRKRLPLILALTGGALLLLLGSPLILVVVDSWLHILPWDRLTEIGQSYTGVAALLSGAALVGIAYSIRLQTQQIAVMRSQAVREMQFNLLRLAMEDPSMAIMRAPAEVEAEYRKRVYIVQIIRYLEFAYASGELSESSLRSTLINEILADSTVRSQWTTMMRPVWGSTHEAGTRAQRRFLTIMDDSCAAAEDLAASRSGTE